MAFFARIVGHWSLTEPSKELAEKVLSSHLLLSMEKFVTDITYMEIHSSLQAQRFYWSTFTPFLSLCYNRVVHTTQEKDDAFYQASLLCVKVGLVSMKSLCLEKNVVEIVEYEGLADYMTCLPWNMPDSVTTASATEVVHIARQSLTLQPPSLVNIVKAQLASYHCGLEKVLQCDAYALVVDVMENSFSL